MQDFTAKVIFSGRVQKLDPALISCARDWADESNPFRPGHRMGTFCLDKYEWWWAIEDRMCDGWPERILHLALEQEHWEARTYDRVSDQEGYAGRLAGIVIPVLSSIRTAFRALTVRARPAGQGQALFR